MNPNIAALIDELRVALSLFTEVLDKLTATTEDPPKKDAKNTSRETMLSKHGTRYMGTYMALFDILRKLDAPTRARTLTKEAAKNGIRMKPTTIYDYLNSMVYCGDASVMVIDNVRYYSPKQEVTQNG